MCMFSPCGTIIPNSIYFQNKFTLFFHIIFHPRRQPFRVLTKQVLTYEQDIWAFQRNFSKCIARNQAACREDVRVCRYAWPYAWRTLSEAKGYSSTMYHWQQRFSDWDWRSVPSRLCPYRRTSATMRGGYAWRWPQEHRTCCHRKSRCRLGRRACESLYLTILLHYFSFFNLWLASFPHHTPCRWHWWRMLGNSRWCGLRVL